MVTLEELIKTREANKIALANNDAANKLGAQTQAEKAEINKQNNAAINQMNINNQTNQFTADQNKDKNLNILQNTALSNMGNNDNTRMQLGGKPIIGSTDDPFKKLLGFANGGKLGIIPGKVDKTVADDTTVTLPSGSTINAKKGEYIIPDWAVPALGEEFLNSKISAIAKKLGIDWKPGAKAPGEPDSLGRMDKPNLVPKLGAANGGAMSPEELARYQAEQLKKIQQSEGSGMNARLPGQFTTTDGLQGMLGTRPELLAENAQIVADAEAARIANNAKVGNAPTFNAALTQVPEMPYQRLGQGGNIQSTPNQKPTMMENISNHINRTESPFVNAASPSLTFNEPQTEFRGKNITQQEFQAQALADNEKAGQKANKTATAVKTAGASSEKLGQPTTYRTTGAGTGYIEIDGKKTYLAQDNITGDMVIFDGKKATHNLGQPEDKKISFLEQSNLDVQKFVNDKLEATKKAEKDKTDKEQRDSQQKAFEANKKEHTELVKRFSTYKDEAGNQLSTDQAGEAANHYLINRRGGSGIDVDGQKFLVDDSAVQVANDLLKKQLGRHPKNEEVQSLIRQQLPSLRRNGLAAHTYYAKLYAKDLPVNNTPE